jgi:hypothetical protein
MYIIEIVYYIKVTIGGLEQNSDMIITHVIDQIFNSSFIEVILKKIVNNTVIELYNKLSHNLKI